MVTYLKADEREEMLPQPDWVIVSEGPNFWPGNHSPRTMENVLEEKLFGVFFQQMFVVWIGLVRSEKPTGERTGNHVERRPQCRPKIVEKSFHLKSECLRSA